MKRKTKKPKVSTMQNAPDGKSEDMQQDEDGSDISFDEEEGMSDQEQNSVTSPPAKMAKLNKPNLYKPPTNEELTQLRETENLFQSSLFRMQITELLSEVLVKEKKKAAILDYCKKLSDELIKLKGLKDRDIVDQEWVKKANLSVPLKQQPFQVKGRFHFVAPKSVKMIGSFPLGTSIRPDASIDLALEIPKECIQAKDHLNQRYFRKRALYLVAVARHLNKSELVSDMKFTFLHDNRLKPVLILVPAGKFGKLTVRLHTCVEEGAFKLSRFHVNKNNVRSAWYNGEKTSGGNEESERGTAHYNTSMLGEMTVLATQSAMQAALEEGDGVRDGLALLKVWLRQRQLNVGGGCFSNFLMTMYVVFLLKQRKLNGSMSSYQVMRNTLHYLSLSDWESSPPSLLQVSDSSAPLLSDLQDNFSLVFVDTTGYVNYAADLALHTYNMVRHEAKLAITFLETSGCDGFEALFMQPMNFFAKYDQAVHLSQLDQFSAHIQQSDLSHLLMDHGGDVVRTVLPSLMQLLHRGVGRRVSAMSVRQLPPQQWGISEACPAGASMLTLGFLLDPDTCNSVIDKGPAADSAQASEFREFWGEKCELRRFQDGSICEAVVWPCSSTADKRTVLTSIVKYLLNRHFSLAPSSMHRIGQQLDSVLRLPRSKHSKLVHGTGEEQHLAVITCYDDLCKQLRELKDLPLSIHSIQGVDPAFRFAEVFPPVPVAPVAGLVEDEGRSVPTPDGPTPHYTIPLKVLCLLEASGKWPDDVEAIQRIKAAFHIQLAQQLTQQYSLPTQVFVDHILVLKSGYVFRVEIGYQREISLRRMVQTVDGMVKMLDTEDATSLEQALVHTPKLSSTLHGLHQQHSSWSCGVRLGKRWLRSQLLCERYISDEAVELIMAHVYLHPQPYNTPRCPLSAFLRFLRLLGTHDWKTQPLIVNLNNQLTKEDFTAITSRFTRDRATLPWMFLASADDKFTSRWTKRRPTAPILQRIVLLARESLSVLQQQLEQTTFGRDIKQIFRPPLEAFDVILKLKPKYLARGVEAIDKADGILYPEYTTDVKDKIMPVVAFDPVQEYLRDLRSAFDDFALFFADPFGGSYIAVLWKPNVKESQPFKASHTNSMMVDQTTDHKKAHLIFNKGAAIEDFRVLGQGLLKSVVQNTH